MKHKVGDKVRIKSLDWYNNNGGGNKAVNCGVAYFYTSMKEYCGKIATITECRSSYYILDIDNLWWHWTDEMFDETYNTESKKIKINLPKDCEVGSVNASVEDDFIIVEYIPKNKFVPKNGDVTYLMSKRGERWVGIHKGTNNSPFANSLWNHCSLNLKFKTLNEKPSWIEWEKIEKLRLATEEEKKMLFDSLEKEGFLWNEVENKIEKIRWRARRDESYYFINSDGEVEKDYDIFSKLDSKRFEFGNYFKAREEALEYADKIKELLKNR